MAFGSLGYSGFVVGGSGGGGGNPPSGTGYYQQITFTVGAGSPLIGTDTYQNNTLIGALNLNFGIINNLPEFVTLNNTTGTITRTNPWQQNDQAAFPFSRTS